MVGLPALPVPCRGFGILAKARVRWPLRSLKPSALSFQMWKASAGHAVSITQDDGGADDWETDPDFVV